ncbi:unnamed protein product [[Candida] boidinii]|nr:unnamed protein product [[Candida] boidinii]
MSEASGEKKTFIITLKEHTTDPAVASFKKAVEGLGGEIQHEYSLIKGFSVKLPSVHFPELKKHQDVATIEEDQEVRANSA